MNSDQMALYERAGELARRYHESKRRDDEEQGPAMPRGPFRAAIRTGFNGTAFGPQSSPTTGVASFANRMGMLARVTQIWKDEKALVKSLFFSYQVDDRALRGSFSRLIWILSLGY